MNKEKISARLEKREIIPLAYDTMFKAVFIKEEKVLIKMLKDIFDINEAEQIFTMLGYETVSPKFTGKTYRGDILIKLSDKSYVLVEMNYNNNISAIDRNLVQLTRIHSQILKEGEEDEELSKYRLRGLNFNNFKNLTGKPVESFAVCNLENNKIATMMYTFCNIDIEKCKKMVYDINISNLPNSVRWGAILKESNIDKISYILGDDMLPPKDKERFLKTMERISSDKSILNDWVLEMLAENKVKSQIKYAKQEAIREGFKEGIEKGLEQGLEQGIEQGIEQGTRQGEENSKIEVIKNMLSMNVDYEFISKVTGKNIEDIKAIEENM